MSDKTTFSELATGIDSGAKCCGNCLHARVQFEASVAMKIAVCKALPPTVVIMPTNQGPIVTSKWPNMRLTDDCDLFESSKSSEVP